MNPYGPTLYLTPHDGGVPELRELIETESLKPLVLDFVTWAWVIETIAGAVLAWAAKSVMDSLFATTSGGKVTVQEFLDLIQQTMRQALAEYDVKMLSRRYQALIEDVREYKASGGRHRLDEADIAVNELIIGFKSYGDITADLLASAQLFKIAVLQTYVTDRIRDETANIKRLAADYKEDLEAAAKTRLALINGYYGRFIAKNGGHGEPIEFGFSYKGDFVPVTYCYPYQGPCMREAGPKVKEEEDRIKQLEITHRYDPFLKAIDVLDRILKGHRPK